MSFWSDYYFDYDPFDRDYYDGPEPKSCTECGRSGLYWKEVRPGVFRLFDEQLGEFHKCPPALDFK